MIFASLVPDTFYRIAITIRSTSIGFPSRPPPFVHDPNLDFNRSFQGLGCLVLLLGDSFMDGAAGGFGGLRISKSLCEFVFRVDVWRSSSLSSRNRLAADDVCEIARNSANKAASSSSMMRQDLPRACCFNVNLRHERTLERCPSCEVYFYCSECFLCFERSKVIVWPRNIVGRELELKLFFVGSAPLLCPPHLESPLLLNRGKPPLVAFDQQMRSTPWIFYLF